MDTAMPRNMQFAMSANQIRDKTKTVTRRIGWGFLRPGDILNACVKCTGLRKGEKIQRLAQIRIIRTRIEPLSRILKDEAYGAAEATKEGFKGWTGDQFVDMLSDHMELPFGIDTLVNRIEFEYVEIER
jgi:hypothetical protein